MCRYSKQRQTLVPACLRAAVLNARAVKL